MITSLFGGNPKDSIPRNSADEPELTKSPYFLSNNFAILDSNFLALTPICVDLFRQSTTAFISALPYTVFA